MVVFFLRLLVVWSSSESSSSLDSSLELSSPISPPWSNACASGFKWYNLPYLFSTKKKNKSEKLKNLSQKNRKWIKSGYIFFSCLFVLFFLFHFCFFLNFTLFLEFNFRFDSWKSNTNSEETFWRKNRNFLFASKRRKFGVLIFFKFFLFVQRRSEVLQRECSVAEHWRSTQIGHRNNSILQRRLRIHQKWRFQQGQQINRQSARKKTKKVWEKKMEKNSQETKTKISRDKKIGDTFSQIFSLFQTKKKKKNNSQMFAKNCGSFFFWKIATKFQKKIRYWQKIQRWNYERKQAKIAFVSKANKNVVSE